MDKSGATQLYRIVINASARAIWDAITLPEWTEKYGYSGRVDYELKASGRFSHRASAEMKAMGMPDEIIVGDVIGAPMVAGMVPGGGEPSKGGGGWPWVLSDLKSLLETGKRMPV